MKQRLKNKYYELIENDDFPTQQLINVVFTKIDSFRLENHNKDCQAELLEIIKELEIKENKLYKVMAEDIKNGVI